MKKLLCLMLSILVLFGCVAGCKKNDTSSDSDTTKAEGFVKPESYASVILVTINPQFRLYISENNEVLAVEPVNDDAKSIAKEIKFEGKKIETVVENLITVSADNGFVKENAEINFTVSEVVNDSINPDALLNKVKDSAQKKLEKLDIKAEITTAFVTEPNEDNSQADTPSDTTSSDNTTTPPANTPKPDNTVNADKTCKHTKTGFIAISTGENIIDASKLDMVNHMKYCTECNTNLSLEKHSVKDGKCTVCSQSNFEITTINAINAGVSGADNFGLDEARIRADGTPDSALVLDCTVWLSDNTAYAKDEFNYEIPESVILENIRKKFEFSDAQFEKLKAEGTYHFFFGTQRYENGIFYIINPAAGGPGDFTHTPVGYKDNKNGTFEIYYDYQSGGPENPDYKHLYYYAVTYTYKGASNLEVIIGEYGDASISGWKAVVDSMKVASIKKVDSISGITKF
ncbi:MAG: hypothetical protein E7560_04190 [Ruminococcaceae bacterium]|nr:hypothetical protein [Oscillospiraceae bacterium]